MKITTTEGHLRSLVHEPSSERLNILYKESKSGCRKRPLTEHTLNIHEAKRTTLNTNDLLLIPICHVKS